jgi:hypothetical protein
MMIDDLHQPVARCIPSNDADLAAAANGALARAPVSLDDFDVAAYLECVLGEAYPRVVVVPMNPLASEWGARAWYVYRDGR